jgi:hypothetical protein
MLILSMLTYTLACLSVNVRLLVSRPTARRMLPTAMLILILRYCGKESHLNVMMMRVEMKLAMMILVAASK